MKPAGVASVVVLAMAAIAAWATAPTLRSSTRSATTPSAAEVVTAPSPAPAAELKFDDERLARVEAMLAGKDSHEYSFDARRGQRIELTLSSDQASWIGLDLREAPPVASAAAFADGTRIYSNFIDGSTRWEGVAPASGTYTVRVGLLNSQARALDGVDYQLAVNLK